MLNVDNQVKTAKGFPKRIVTNIVGKERDDICLYCGYVVEKCVCQYEGGMLRG